MFPRLRGESGTSTEADTFAIDCDLLAVDLVGGAGDGVLDGLGSAGSGILGGVGRSGGLVDGGVGGGLRLVDVLGELAAGLLVDEVAGLVDGALNLVDVLVEQILALSARPSAASFAFSMFSPRASLALSMNDMSILPGAHLRILISSGCPDEVPEPIYAPCSSTATPAWVRQAIAPGSTTDPR